MLEWLNIATVGFIVVFLGTLFLIGELLVRAKGVFSLIGVGMISIYFIHHLTGDVGTWVVLFYVIGLALIIFDGNVTSDGTIAAIGIVFMIIALAVPAPDMVYRILVGMAVIIGALAALMFLRVFPKRNMWTKMTLKDQLTSERGYNTMNESYKALVGKTGETLTVFRPAGTVEIEGQPYSAISGGQFLQAGVKVEVVLVDGTGIVIKPCEDKEES
ncbi:NfeD family protein [Shouchella lonarensis]|uniref:NfeD-like C-terminal, partner-binding n=1 Tax=Shouchella lonarensis TaxID=1464122 RepID=A0A1G6KNU5_9BACI|nr:NfeD family protein [Shouchella lonarensis]SDC32508.1 NfeD-like C-terminal, partner-binding [Shouchella lonarensis]